jgi:hypothetical protein
VWGIRRPSRNNNAKPVRPKNPARRVLMTVDLMIIGTLFVPRR